MTHQILIASYAKDFPWLLHNLASQKLFCRGFLPPTVVVPNHDVAGAQAVAAQSYPEARVIGAEPPPRPAGAWSNFLRAQIDMMKGDIHCPEADYVHLLGSDCFVRDVYHPEQVFKDGKPVMLYSSYAALEVGHPAVKCWYDGTEHALGFEVEHEFMRRLPLVYPRDLYCRVRKWVSDTHNSTFEGYVYSRGHAKNHSESNILGAYAWKFMHHAYHWANLDDKDVYGSAYKEYPSSVIQFWSHGGMDHPADCSHNYESLEGTRSTFGRTPRTVMDDIYAWARTRPNASTP